MRWQMLVGVAVVLVSAAALSGQTKEIQDKTKEMLKLQGTWVFQSATFKGKPNDNIVPFDMVITRDKMVMVLKRDGKEDRSEPIPISIDVKKTPRVLSIITKGSQKGKAEPVETVQKAIYEVDGDTLKMAPAPPSREPPASFKDENAVIVIYKRAKSK